MPVRRLTASGTPNVKKKEDEKESLDALIRQANGLEPILCYPRISEGREQWDQFLHAIEQPEPLWPLFSVVSKVPLKKCDKCSREFCSLINYRRHLRIDHRLKKLDKDPKTNRDLLGEYWEKLSVEEAMEVVSFEGVMLEELPASSILRGVTTLRRQAFSTLPHYYLRAGVALLDIVQSKASSFPISSQELFGMLDNASEGTFLCGTAVSVHRFMFGGETRKIGLEPRNLIACASFLLEQKLVNACLAYKDAEALRLQKLLVDEEEAAQKRQAEILERKRKKKLRQKEQKARERLEDDMKIEGNISSTGEGMSQAEASLAAFGFKAHDPDMPADHNSSSLVTYQCSDTIEGVDGEAQSGYDCDTDLFIEQQISQGQNRLLPMTAREQELSKSQSPVANSLNAKQNSQMSKLGAIQKYGTNSDQNAAPIVSGGKALSSKPEKAPKVLNAKQNSQMSKLGAIQKYGTDSDQNAAPIVSGGKALSSKPETAPKVLNAKQDSQMSKLGAIQKYGTNSDRNAAPIVSGGKALSSKPETAPKVLIGSVPVNLGNCSQSEGNLVASPGVCSVDNLAKQNTAQDKRTKLDSFQGGDGCLTPVSQHQSEGPLPLQSGGTEAGKDDQVLSVQNSLRLCRIDASNNSFASKFSHTGAKADGERLQFSSDAARAFLAQRWKEAMASDHVKLVLSPDTEPPVSQPKLYSEVAACHPSSNVGRHSVRANAEKLSAATSGAVKYKPRMKAGKEIKTQYIPKQKPAA